MKNLKTFSITAILEGISYLGFMITMPLKYYMDMPMPNKIVGMVHGVLFIAYVYYAYVVTKEQKWTQKQFWILFVASLIPFGTFYIDKKYIQPALK